MTASRTTSASLVLVPVVGAFLIAGVYVTMPWFVRRSDMSFARRPH
ncbi:MAG: hypothetical protein WBZ40_05505 [Acidimicrobiia bacterium]